MAKKAPRGKLLTLKPKSKAKVIPIKSAKPGKANAKSKPGKATNPAKKPRANVISLQPKKRRPEVTPQVMPPPPIEHGADHADDGLREAMEELVAARQELSRLGHELTLAKRDLENRKLSSGSAQEHLRSELAAVRTGLFGVESAKNRHTLVDDRNWHWRCGVEGPRSCAGAGRKGEEMQVAEGQVADEVVRLLKLAIGFAGESDHDVGAESERRAGSGQ